MKVVTAINEQFKQDYYRMTGKKWSILSIFDLLFRKEKRIEAVDTLQKKKIILYIDMMERGGAQRVVANLIQHFLENNLCVVLVNDFKEDSSRPQYFVDSRVKRYFLRNTLEGNPIVKNFERVIRLRKIVRAEKPNVVLSFLGRPNERMLVATVGLKTRKIVSVRNDPNREYGSGGVKKWFARKLFGLADGCVFQTEEAANYFSESVRRKSTVILNPVDMKFFEKKPVAPLKNIVTVGRLEPQKNQKLLISAFSEIADSFPDEKLIIYGEGSLRDELSEFCKLQGIADRVEFPGNITNVENVLSKAKIFALSSDYEGLPNALMEAMAVGVPCISTDCPCGGPRTLDGKSKCIYLVPVGDKGAFANGLRELLNEPEKLRSFGERAKLRAGDFMTEKILTQWDCYLFAYNCEGGIC